MASARDPGLTADLPFAEAAARTLEIRAAELREHAGGVLDTVDIERVHDMRVASRRLRAVLEIFAPAFPPKAHGAALREVKALADALGARRDPDVQLAALDGVVGPGIEVLVTRLRAEQSSANAALAAALRRAAERRLDERLLGLVAAARGRAAP
jgi:CHAD domain-containing protein